MNGWAVLSWIEAVPENGPSTKAKAEDVGAFSVVESFKGESSSVSENVYLLVYLFFWLILMIYLSLANTKQIHGKYNLGLKSTLS